MMRDPVSCSTHFLAFIVALFYTLFLYRLSRSKSVRIFGISATLLYASSALFHMPLWSPTELRTFQLMDQSMIFVLIAGTFTPLAVLLVPPRVSRIGLFVMWSLAFIGIFSLWVLPRLPHVALVGIYIGMGTFALANLLPFLRSIDFSIFALTFLGTAIYAAGGICEMLQWPTIVPGVVGHHEVLHICDMIATACHAVAIMKLALTLPPRPAAEHAISAG